MFTVDGRGGAIILADRMSVAGIPQSLHIGGTDLRREHGRRRSPSSERVIDDGVGDRHQDALG
jgi:hypothetical protein